MRKAIRNVSVILAALSVVGCSREVGPALTTAVPTTLETTENAGATTAPETTTETAEETTAAANSTGYLTVEKAIELCEKWEEGYENTGFFFLDMKKIFDSVVDVPAEPFGSGEEYWAYYTDEKKEKFISIGLNEIYLIPAGKYFDSGEVLYKIKEPYTLPQETTEDICELDDNLFETSYEVASEEQKKQLDALKEKYGVHVAHYVKEIKMIMGELPEGTTGSVTLEQVKKLFEGFTYDDLIAAEELGKDWDTSLCEKMNSIAGAPDYVNWHHSGDYRYYVEGGEGNYVRVGDGCVEYINAEDRSQLDWIFPEE